MINQGKTDQSKVDTRDHILEVALELFAEHGYDGASIRAIAKQADVNIASINYYFKAKHNLYWAAMSHSHSHLQEMIAGFGKKSKNVEELVGYTFDFACDNRLMFRNTIKMMLSDAVPDPDGEFVSCGITENDEQGPPGAIAFGQKIKEELGSGIKAEDLRWAVESVFGAFFHWTVFCCSSKYDIMKEREAHLQQSEIRKRMLRTVTAIKSQIKV